METRLGQGRKEEYRKKVTSVGGVYPLPPQFIACGLIRSSGDLLHHGYAFFMNCAPQISQGTM
jgi:hypothetical protein